MDDLDIETYIGAEEDEVDEVDEDADINDDTLETNYAFVHADHHEELVKKLEAFN